MKAKITDNNDEFKPFDITLTVETKEEADLLRVIFNDDSLGDRFRYQHLKGLALNRFGISDLIWEKIKGQE